MHMFCTHNVALLFLSLVAISAHAADRADCVYVPRERVLHGEDSVDESFHDPRLIAAIKIFFGGRGILTPRPSNAAIMDSLSRHTPIDVPFPTYRTLYTAYRGTITRLIEGVAQKGKKISSMETACFTYLDESYTKSTRSIVNSRYITILTLTKAGFALPTEIYKKIFDYVDEQVHAYEVDLFVMLRIHCRGEIKKMSEELQKFYREICDRNMYGD